MAIFLDASRSAARAVAAERSLPLYQHFATILDEVGVGNNVTVTVVSENGKRDIEMRVIRETLRHTRGDKRLAAKLPEYWQA